MTSLATVIANNRFGLGAANAAGEVQFAAAKADLLRQLDAGSSRPSQLARYPASAEILKALYASRSMQSREQKREVRKHYQRLFLQEVSDRLLVGIQTETPLVERLVMFWSNHFTVSSSKGLIAPAIGAYEREAIRPHVLGKFEDLLIAVCQHIVMLVYLDNHVSVGPNSKAGRRRQRDLNENFAREILELHTLGVNGGYQQKDVTELALALTGWTHGARVGKRARQRGVEPDPNFLFRAAIHEPGERVVLGKRYRDQGHAQGVTILRDLARHPSTARFVATKLLRHFVQDEPSDASVGKLADVYRQTDGDLRAVVAALVSMDVAWDAGPKKIKTPYELVVSTYRAVGLVPRRRRYTINALRQMGHMPFAAPSPAGWPDTARHWLSPESLLRRIEWARAITATFSRDLDPQHVLKVALGSTVSEQTAVWVSRAPSAQAALAMVFASHEFQRR